MVLHDRKPKDRPGFKWDYHDGCNCPNCPWKGKCIGRNWPYWKQARTALDAIEQGAQP